MKHSTRLCGLAAAVAMVATAGNASAQYPEGSINLIVPFGAGGTTDAVARVLAVEFQGVLGQTVVVRNETGAAGTVGMANLARQAPDGYTLGYIPIGPLALQTNMRDLPYSVDDFTYICRVSDEPNLLLVQRGGPFKSVDDIVTAAQDKPGELVYVGVPGGMPHISMAGFNQAYGLDMKQISGDTATAARYIAGGVAQFHSSPVAATNSFDLDPVAVFGSERSEAFPDVPTLKELGKDLEFSTWFGIVGPAGMPADVVAKLESACSQSVENANFKEALAKLGTPIRYQDSEAFEAFVKSQYESLGAVIDAAGLKNAQ